MAQALFGVVVDTKDPESIGRVQVSLPDVSGDITLPWIRVAQPIASSGSGVFLLPEVDDKVVILEGPGGTNGMVVVGALYTGKATPANPDSDGKNVLKQIITAGGNEVTLDDTSGSESITIQNADGKVMIEWDASGTKLTLVGDQEVNISSTSKVVLDAMDVEITGSNGVTISGTAKVEIGSDASVKVEGTQVEISGKGTVKISGPMVEIG